MIAMMSIPRPRDYAENAIVTSILDGTFPPGSVLPGERQLAEQLGLTRPTLREAIQRLTRDGWLTVSHGKATLVNDYWTEGGLNVLSKLVEHKEALPPDFVTHVLEVRLHLAPVYTREAVDGAGAIVAEKLAEAEALPATAAALARYDWQLHQLLTARSGNPVYPLILNGFRGFYEEIAADYFAFPVARALSQRFYAELRVAALAADADSAERVCRRVMQMSLALWARRDAAEAG
jgi:GntR family negative regulator for fad regulon and positive regulator of fabA